MGQGNRGFTPTGSCSSTLWAPALVLLAVQMTATRGWVLGARVRPLSSFLSVPANKASLLREIHKKAPSPWIQVASRWNGVGSDETQAWEGIIISPMVVPPPIPSPPPATSTTPLTDDILFHPPTVIARGGSSGEGGQSSRSLPTSRLGDGVLERGRVHGAPRLTPLLRDGQPPATPPACLHRKTYSSPSAEVDASSVWLPTAARSLPPRNTNDSRSGGGARRPSPRLSTVADPAVYPSDEGTAPSSQASKAPAPLSLRGRERPATRPEAARRDVARAGDSSNARGLLRFADETEAVEPVPYVTIAAAAPVSVQGVVKRITFASTETGFGVLKVEREGSQELVTVVGKFGPISVGMGLLVRGEWRQDARWGRQLAAHEYKETAPATQEGIENYLASGLVKGIGPVAARQIVQHFGADTLQVLNEAPERLIEVEGIGKKRVQMFVKAWRDQREVTEVMLFLQSHNVSTTLATKIYKKYGKDSVGVLERNPYQLADEMEGVGFRTVDKIAAQLPGYDPSSSRRHRSGLLFLLNEQANEGHCYGTRLDLLQAGSRLLGASTEALNKVVNEMIGARELIAHYYEERILSSSALGRSKELGRQGEALFLPFFDRCEAFTARRIQELMTSSPVSPVVAALAENEKKAARAIERVQEWSGVVFDEAQYAGLMTAARGRLTVLTGGPGTGKTTMALAIIRLFEHEGAAVALAAPTGRAAQRLADGTGLEAKTIHRLLEYSSETKEFARGPANRLDCDVLVVDEASMVDIVLMHHLLAALPASASVVLVGDVDQLPPVGPGNVLRDIIDSRQVAVVRLSNIFRQAAQSAIVMNAHRINRGEMPDFGSAGMKRGKKEASRGKQHVGKDVGAPASSPLVSLNDFFLIEEEDPTKLVALITELCVKRLPKHYKVDPIKDIQVLCPMKKGEVGTLHLNTVLQQALNPRGATECVRYGGKEFRVGDKVMQVKNNYEKNVFNGGVGTVVEARPGEKSLAVAFDGSDPATPLVTYDVTELDQIMLAYAATVHKAQGSEYCVVVAPLLHRQHYIMLQRNLLYTCVTRAKEVLVLVGSRAAVAKAVSNDMPSSRNSLLHQRLVDLGDNYV